MKKLVLMFVAKTAAPAANADSDTAVVDSAADSTAVDSAATDTTNAQ